MNLSKDKKELERQRQGRLFLLRSLAIAGIVAGIVILLRGWGLSLNTNGFVADGSVVKRNPLPINTVLSISGLTIPQAGGQKSSWGENITNYFGLPETQGFWLVQTKAESEVIAEFLPQKAETVLNIPRTFVQSKLFKTGQFLGLTAYNVNQPQQLLATNPKDTKSLVQLFEFTQTYIVNSFFFTPNYQEIYYSLKERDSNNYQIRVIRPNGDEINVYNSNLYQINKILNVNLVKGYLDFTANLSTQNTTSQNSNSVNAGSALSAQQNQGFDKSKSLCFRLDLQNNNVSELPCGAVNTDGFDKGYAVTLNSDNNQEIFSYSYENLQPELVFAANVGDKLSLLTRVGDFLLWQAQDLAGGKRIYIYNLARREVRSINTLPNAEPVQLWILQEKVVIVGRTSPDTYRIFIESAAQTSVSSQISSTNTNNSLSPSSSTTSINSSLVNSTLPSSSNNSTISSIGSTASQISSDDFTFTQEETSGWSMYTFNSCVQNCKLQILNY